LTRLTLEHDLRRDEYWRDDKNDMGTVTEKHWAEVTLNWDNRSQQSALHNDMACVGVVSKK
jgi:hypothetical protein